MVRRVSWNLFFRCGKSKLERYDSVTLIDVLCLVNPCVLKKVLSSHQMQTPGPCDTRNLKWWTWSEKTGLFGWLLLPWILRYYQWLPITRCARMEPSGTRAWNSFVSFAFVAPICSGMNPRLLIHVNLVGGFKHFFIFHPLPGEKIPVWLIFFRWVGSTTNQKFMGEVCFSLIFQGSGTGSCYFHDRCEKCWRSV